MKEYGEAIAARMASPGNILRQHVIPGLDMRFGGLSLSAAIAHIHRYGLIHRDIKPANVVFVGSAPKLADIGLVAAVGQVTYAGTPGFIPKGGPGRPPADIYSVGKLLYEAMTGLSAKDDFPRLLSNPAKTMQRLNQVILKACADDPQMRYQSGHELHSALARLR